MSEAAVTDRVFQPLHQGRFRRHQIGVRWEEERQVLPRRLQQEIDGFWQREILQSGKGDSIFNGELCRLNGWQQAEKRLQLRLGRTDYRHLLFSNRHGEELTRRFGATCLARALGISAVLLSRDGSIILIKRSQEVGEFPGRFDVIGGHIHPGEHAAAGVPDPFLAIAAEVREETGVELNPDDLECLGLIETLATRKPELVFRATVHLSGTEIVTAGQKTGSSEIATFRTVRNEAAALAELLERESARFSPSALGALWLHQAAPV